MKDKRIVCFGLRSQYTSLAETIIVIEFCSSTPVCRKRRICNNSIKLLVAKCIRFKSVTILNVKVIVLYTMQKHIHSGKVECCWILFLPENTICLTTLSCAKQQRTGTACWVIYILQASLSCCYNLCKYLTDFLWSIELTCFFTSTCSELTNHIFVCIAKNIYISCFFQTEINSI